MNSPSKEVTATNSQSVLISEVADLRRELWLLISTGKQIAHAMPAKERTILIEAMSRAENRLSK